MPIKARITEDMKVALRGRETQRLSAIRLLLAAIKQREVDERVELADAEIFAVIDKMLKQRRDSIAQFEAAGRQDLVDSERFEVEVLKSYMPASMPESEIEAAVNEVLAATGATDLQDMGKVMAMLKPRLAGRADMAKVSALVKARLSHG